MSVSAPAVPSELTGTFVIDPTHSRIGFVARHAMVTKVRGAFTEFDGSAVLNADDPTASTATITLSTASISTGQAQRDQHLLTGDFLDVDTFPQIRFVSTGVTRDGEGFVLDGDLTIKGVTRAVSIAFEHTGLATDPYGNVRAGFEGKAALLRSDFGLTWNAALETGGVLVSDKINLEFDISAIKQ